jgi:hypothetical protein
LLHPGLQSLQSVSLNKLKTEAEKLPPSLLEARAAKAEKDKKIKRDRKKADKDAQTAADKVAAAKEKEAEAARKVEAARKAEASRNVKAARTGLGADAAKEGGTVDLLQPSPKKSKQVVDAADSPPLPPPKAACPAGAVPLPTGWKQAVDPSGTTYYYNRSLNLSQYEFPNATSELPPLLPPTYQSPHLSMQQAAARLDQGSAGASTSAGNKYLETQLVEHIASKRAQMVYATGEAKLLLAGELAVLECKYAIGFSSR